MRVIDVTMMMMMQMKIEMEIDGVSACVASDVLTTKPLRDSGLLPSAAIWYYVTKL